MQIMLCGAGDIVPFLEDFKSQANLFEWRPICFLDGNLKYTNYQNYSENSVETVKRSDLVVFVINQDYGEITWQNEFNTANEEGITYIILCHSDTFKKYVDFNWSESETSQINENDLKLFKVLNEIENLQKTIITYTTDSFIQNLRKQLSLTIEQAAKALNKENRRKVLLDIVLSKDKEKIKEFALPRHREFLIDILFDIFQKKEVRKRVLEVFTINENFKLETEELILCLNDFEQGVQRKTIELLPKLVRRRPLDMDRIFLVLKELILNSDDVGIDRRVFLTMLNLDLVRAVKELPEIPFTDVGSPRRIFQWIEQNFYSETMMLTLKNNPGFNEELDNLLGICQNFRLSNDTWKKNIEPLRAKLKNIDG